MNVELDKPSQATKAIIPGILSVLVLITPVFAPGGVDVSIYTVLTVLVALGNAPLVFALGGTKAKTYAQAAVAAIQVILATLSTASTWTDLASVPYELWVSALLAAAGIFGVGLIPNAPLAEKVVPVSEAAAAAEDPKAI